jgi:hypothetical protein
LGAQITDTLVAVLAAAAWTMGRIVLFVLTIVSVKNRFIVFVKTFLMVNGVIDFCQ